MSDPYQINMLTKMAEILQNFLPNDPHPFADPKISFKGIAQSFGILEYWQKSNKISSIINLLNFMYFKRNKDFPKFIYNIFLRANTYRMSKQDPITKEEIIQLNKLLKELKFSIPKLKDEKFLNSLPIKKNGNLQESIDDLLKSFSSDKI